MQFLLNGFTLAPEQDQDPEIARPSDDLRKLIQTWDLAGCTPRLNPNY